MIPDHVIKQAVEQTRTVTKMTGELTDTYAEVTKKYVDALEKQGFTRTEAIQLASNLRLNGGSK